MPIEINDLPSPEESSPEELAVMHGGIAVPYYISLSNTLAREQHVGELWGTSTPGASSEPL